MDLCGSGGGRLDCPERSNGTLEAQEAGRRVRCTGSTLTYSYLFLGSSDGFRCLIYEIRLLTSAQYPSVWFGVSKKLVTTNRTSSPWMQREPLELVIMMTSFHGNQWAPSPALNALPRVLSVQTATFPTKKPAHYTVCVFVVAVLPAL